MPILKPYLAASAIALGALIPLAGFAQMAMEPGKAQAAQPASMTDGEIRKIDLEAGKVTIRHGEIKHMDMPGMTMVFTAKDKALLSNIKAGDKVKFMVVYEDGKIVVTDIQPAP
ncbi:copper-binding protein [uncultured Pseudacidovorax sp.]|uniref:copper-binding protein n=1 Tax=uncultured Pseudacidovorax sp. TaxID=679313 RepID=UPI0025EDCF43|nr:copper-binding protein [uncultured Pseudacidovorax sp.]